MSSNQLHVRNGGGRSGKTEEKTRRLARSYREADQIFFSFYFVGSRAGGSQSSQGVLKEMNDLESGHDEFVKSLVPRVDVPRILSISVAGWTAHG